MNLLLPTPAFQVSLGQGAAGAGRADRQGWVTGESVLSTLGLAWRPPSLSGVAQTPAGPQPLSAQWELPPATDFSCSLVVKKTPSLAPHALDLPWAS